MAAPVNRSSASLLTAAALTRAAASRTASTASAAAPAAAGQTPATDLLSIQDLPARLAQATEQTRQVQHRAQAAQSAERNLRSLEPQLRQLRDLARQASAAGLSSDKRTDLSAQFRALQTRVRIAAASASYQGRDLGELLQPAAKAPADSAQATQVQVSGGTVAAGQQVEERKVALEESQVARDRGVTEVQATVAHGTAVFRFEDTGNGRVRATRYEQQGGQLVEVGSQTVAVPNLRDQRLAGGQVATLEFNRLGLQISLGARYAAGDLGELQLEATAPSTPAASVPATEAAQDRALTYDLGDVASAQDAATGLDQMLTRVDQLRRELRAEQVSQRQNAVAMLQDGEAAAGSAAPLNSGTAQSISAALRQLVLQQSASALAAQGNLEQERAAGLLAG